MSINSVGVLRLGADTKSVGCLDLPDNCGWNEHLSDYTDNPGDCEIGDVLLVPAYRLEEVEEVVEPEKPGVPVEPYVGLSWTNDDGTTRVVFAVNGATIGYVHNAFSKWSVISEDLRRICDIPGYPRTPSTPAVTRKVKKWVKIDHPEVPSDGIA